MFHDAREIVILAQQDEGEALVVAQQDVERRLKRDELRFQQQRLGFELVDDFHRAALADHALQAVGEPGDLRVIRHPRLQAARLADIEDVALAIQHAIDAGTRLQRPDGLADGIHPGFEIRLGGDRVGGAFLVETLLPTRVVRSAGLLIRHHGSR